MQLGKCRNPVPLARVLAERVDHDRLIAMLVGIDDIAALVALVG